MSSKLLAMPAQKKADHRANRSRHRSGEPDISLGFRIHGLVLEHDPGTEERDERRSPDIKIRAAVPPGSDPSHG